MNDVIGKFKIWNDKKEVPRTKFQEPNSKNQAPLLRFGRPTGGGQARQALNSKINAKYQRKRGILEFAIWDYC